MPSALEEILGLSELQNSEFRSSESGATPLTEDQAARIFVEQNAGKLLFCHSTGTWHEWSGAAWVANHTQSVFQRIRDLVRDLARKQSVKVQTKVLKANFVSSVEKFCKNDPTFARTVDQFDTDPWLLGTPLGTVDLRTSATRAADPADCITKLTAVGPSETKNCPLWLRFLAEATGDDADLIRFLQQWCGYCLTGSTCEHALVFVYGPGGNGKSVFLNVLTAILGAYATTSAMDTFTASKSDRHPTDMAMLRGARLVNVSETEEGRAWAEAKIKQLTGGDPISARLMRQDFFTFTPTFKLTIVGNHQPTLHNVDDAARRRFNIVPFLLKPAHPDKQLEEKLKAERSAILRWMIDGCIDWQLNGLVQPQCVIEANAAYFSEQDLMGQWLDELCDVRLGDVSIWTRTADLFSSWSIYSRSAGDNSISLKSFSSALKKRGFSPFRTTHARGFYGIRLLCDRPS